MRVGVGQRFFTSCVQLGVTFVASRPVPELCLVPAFHHHTVSMLRVRSFSLQPTP
jgi:hypothetical protein